MSSVEQLQRRPVSWSYARIQASIRMSSWSQSPTEPKVRGSNPLGRALEAALTRGFCASEAVRRDSNVSRMSPEKTPTTRPLARSIAVPQAVRHASGGHVRESDRFETISAGAAFQARGT